MNRLHLCPSRLCPLMDSFLKEFLQVGFERTYTLEKDCQKVATADPLSREQVRLEGSSQGGRSQNDNVTSQR